MGLTALSQLGRRLRRLRCMRPASGVVLAAAALLANAPLVPPAAPENPAPRASPPDSVALGFQNALRAGAWRTVAGLLHPEAREDFRRWVDIIIAADETGRTRRGVFGEMTSDMVAALPDSVVLVRALERLMADMPGLLHALMARDIAVLGSVREPPDLAHAVYRNTDLLQGAVPEIRVMTLRRAGEEWRVERSEELALIREAMRGIAGRRTPPSERQDALE